MHAAFHGAVRGSRKKRDRPVRDGGQNDEAVAELILEGIAEGAHLFRRHAFGLLHEKLHAADFHGVSEHVFRFACGDLRFQLLIFGLHFLQFVLQCADPVFQFLRRGLQEGGCFAKLFFQLPVIAEDTLSGDGLDPADAGGNAAFRKDLEGADVAGVLNVCAAAEFHGEITHRDHADDVAVFFAEQRHGAQLAGLVDGHFLRDDRERRADLLIDEVFHLRDLFGRHRLEVREVKAQPVGVVQGTGLFDVRAEHDAERLLKQVRRGMILAGVLTVQAVRTERDAVSLCEGTGFHGADVRDGAACQMNGFADPEQSFRPFDQAAVGFLAAHGGVENGLRNDDRAGLAFFQCFGHGAVVGGVREGPGNEYGDLRFIFRASVTDKCSLQGGIDVVVNSLVLAHVVRGLSGASRSLALVLHGKVETFRIHRKAALLQDLFREVPGEAVGIVKPEGVRTGQHGAALGLHLVDLVFQDLKTLVDRPVELVLFFGNDAENDFLLLFELRIAVFRGLDDGTGKGREEGAVHAQEPAVARGTAEKPSEHVSAAVVRGHDAVRDHEGDGTDVVRDDADGNVLLRVFLVPRARDLADVLGQSAQRIHVEQGIHVLHRDSQTLEAHAGVDVLLDELGVIAVAVVVELRENDVPDFHEAVAGSADHVVGAGAVFFTAVVVDLGAGAAGAGALKPCDGFLWPQCTYFCDDYPNCDYVKKAQKEAEEKKKPKAEDKKEFAGGGSTGSEKAKKKRKKKKK